MTIVLDLDYTLLDTERFKQALAIVFSDCGINSERFYESYKKTAEHRLPAYDYDLSRHIEMLSAELTCDADSLRKHVQEVISKTDDYLCEGAREFVLQLKKMGFHVVLLTRGNASWQEQKASNSGLMDLFDEVILVADKKEKALGKMANSQSPVIVVNDNSNEVFDMKKAQPSFHYIIKRGPKGVRDDVDVPIRNTFEEIISDIISIAS